MEHAPFIINNPQNREPAITIHHKTYSIDVNDDHEEPGVGIFDRTTINWPIPIVLGPKPKPCKLGYSALSLNDDRILVMKKGCSTQEDDCFWCLEVNTEYVKEKKKILKDEVVAWSKVVINNSDKHVVITGPSGVGKGTLVSMLMKEFPTKFGFSVSHTTRAPRNMEKDGVDYNFTERTVMEKDIKEGKFLEFACVHGNLYGTSIEAIEAVADKGKRCILEIDVQGARLVKQNSLEAVFIFICPPSMEELEKRLRARGTETEEQILKRLSNAEAEIEQGKSSGVFDHILCNDNLEECYKNLKKVLELDGTRFNYHSVSKVDDKITISCGTENESKRLILLDVSSVRGGAPGRTRINELTNY